MGVPDSETSGPVKKRQRLSLKSARNKTKSPPANTKSTDPKQSPKSEVGKSGTSPQTVSENVQAQVLATGKTPPDCPQTSAEEEEDRSITDSTTTSSGSNRSSETRVPPVSSLENLGNTCFMNSVMQVLRYTPGFLDNIAYLFEDIQASEKIKRKNKLKEEVIPDVDEEASQRSWKVVKNLYKVFRDLSLLEERYEEVASDDVMSMAVKPGRLLNAIREMNAMFEGNMQHDAQEFLRCLLTYLQDAEKEGRKFFSQLPQRFSPRATVNPVMQKFLQSAHEMIRASKTDLKKEAVFKEEESEMSNNATTDTLAVFDTLKEPKCEPECEKVKVNLLSKLAPVSEPSGSDTGASFDKRLTGVEKTDDLSAGPKVGDTAIEVENSLKGKETEGAGVKAMEATVSPGEPDKGKGPVKGKGKSGKEKKSRCAQKKRKSLDSAETIADEENPVVLLQRSSTAKKRLGMRGAVVVKSADDILCASKKPDTNCSTNEPQSPREEDSADLGDTNVVQPAKQEPLTDASVCSSSIRKCKSESAVDSTSFQNMFAKFVSSLAGDDDSVDLISDSDSEDIVSQKKKAKELHETPRRSPRKTNSLHSPARANKPSPLVGSSRSDPAVNNVRTKLCLSFNGEKEVDESVPSSSHNIADSPKPAQCPEATPESLSVATTESSSTPPDTAAQRCKSTPRKSISSSTGSPAVDVAMEPFVKLENCDFIFNKNETSVSASFASKYLSPYKRSPRKVSSNYLKQRNCVGGGGPLGGLSGLEQEMWQAALTDILNSPVKSSSKYDLIERLFQGTMMLRTQCLNCESCRERTEDFHDVSVPVRIEKPESDDEGDGTKPGEDTDPGDESKSVEDADQGEGAAGGCSLIDLIEASTEVERLTADNKYFCDECQCYVEAEISTHYDVMPDILTLHLKRFSHESMSMGCITKISDHVNIPMTLPCLRYKCPKKCLRPDHKYQLYSIITHTGGTLSFGHYLAYCRAFSKKPDLPEPETPTMTNGFLEDGNSHNNANSEPTDGKTHSKKTTPKTVPVTRRKAGVAPKLPSRFNNSVTDTKVKTFANLVAKKSKPDIRETLRTSTHFSTEWFECDDETVRVFEEEEFTDLLSGRDGSLLGTPYLLFYHKATLA